MYVIRLNWIKIPTKLEKSLFSQIFNRTRFALEPLYLTN